MRAMATGAVCGHRGTILRSQSMIAVKEGFHTVRWEIVFGVQPFGRVALAADVDRDFDWQTAFERDNAVLRVTISTGGCVAMAGGNGLAVNAFCDIPGGPVMASATGLSQAGEMQGRVWRGRWGNRVAVVAI